MDEANYTSQAGIFFTCTENSSLAFEQLVPDHLLIHVYAGKMTLSTADQMYVIGAGETGLFARNQLAKLSKEPDGETPFHAVTVLLGVPFLQKFYADLPSIPVAAPRIKALLFGNQTVLCKLFSLIDSYTGLDENFVADELSLLKIKEIVTIIRALDVDTDALLTDFSEPHKIDLAAFMQQHFKFNIAIKRYAYLTGRSLATFKRDFQKTFNTSPQKWLTQKRLEHAHFLMAENQVRPTQAYIEAGFENYSHFTYAFKQFFGYSPSALNPKK